jgi:hypothetical protein
VYTKVKKKAAACKNLLRISIRDQSKLRKAPLFGSGVKVHVEFMMMKSLDGLPEVLFGTRR